MPNVAALLKAEITRISKKSVRQGLQSVQKASATQRQQIVALRRQLEALQREVQQLRKAAGVKKAEPVAAEDTAKMRFVVKGFKSLRTRLGVSAREMGQLLEVSEQTIYNWENKKASPRGAQLAKIAALRGVGKKEVRARLAGPSEAQDGQ